MSLAAMGCGARSLSSDDDPRSQATTSVPIPTTTVIPTVPTGPAETTPPAPISTVSTPEPTAHEQPAASETIATAEPSQFSPCDCPVTDLGVTVWLEQTQTQSTDAGPPIETDAEAKMNIDGGAANEATFLAYMDEPIDDIGCGDGRLHLMPDVRCGLHLWLRVCQGPDAALPCINFEGNDVEFTDAQGHGFRGSLRDGRIGLDEDPPRGLLQGSLALPVTDGRAEFELHGTFAFCGFSYRSGIAC